MIIIIFIIKFKKKKYIYIKNFWKPSDSWNTYMELRRTGGKPASQFL